MELCLSLDVWTRGFERGREFLEVLVVLKSQRRIEMKIVCCMASQVLVFGFKRITCVNMQDTLALHVLNLNWLHVGGIFTITSHASYA